MNFDSGVKVDLDLYTPIFEGEEEGLRIKGYKFDGDFLLDFDWEPGSQWESLEDDDKFREFAVSFIEKMTGRAMSSVEEEDVEFFRSSQAPKAESEAGEAAGACSIG